MFMMRAACDIDSGGFAWGRKRIVIKYVISYRYFAFLGLITFLKLSFQLLNNNQVELPSVIYKEYCS